MLCFLIVNEGGGVTLRLPTPAPPPSSTTKKQSIWATVFYVFCWCKKKKINFFSRNDANRHL